MDTRRNGECRLAYVSTSLSPGSLHSSTGGASRVCKAISRARCSALFTSTALSPHDFSAAVEALAFQSDDVPLVPNVLSPDKCVSGGFSKCQASSYRNYALTWKSGASAPRKWSKDQGAL